MTATPDLTVERRLDLIGAQMNFLVAEAMRTKELKDSLVELTEDLSPVTRQVMDSATAALAVADQRGYVDFARSGLGIADRIVTEFSSEDVEALGDNIVLILETVKEMTQPEVMRMLRSTVHQVREESPAEPPSLFTLARRLREPNVRRGLDRLVVLLDSLGSSEFEEGREKGART